MSSLHLNSVVSLITDIHCLVCRVDTYTKGMNKFQSSTTFRANYCEKFSFCCELLNTVVVDYKNVASAIKCNTTWETELTLSRSLCPKYSDLSILFLVNTETQWYSFSATTISPDCNWLQQLFLTATPQGLERFSMIFIGVPSICIRSFATTENGLPLMCTHSTLVLSWCFPLWGDWVSTVKLSIYCCSRSRSCSSHFTSSGPVFCQFDWSQLLLYHPSILIPYQSKLHGLTLTLALWYVGWKLDCLYLQQHLVTVLDYSWVQKVMFSHYSQRFAGTTERHSLTM